MASKNWKNVKCIAPRTTLIAGNFQANGSSLDTEGWGYTPAAGADAFTWTVTLDDDYEDCLYASAHVNPANADAVSGVAMVDAPLGGANGKTFSLHTKDVSTGVDLQLGATDRISFLLVMSNSNVRGG